MESSQSALEIRDLVVEFPTARGLVRAVDGVSLRLHPGTILGIVGESGSGKTTAMMAATGLIEHRGGIVREGSVLFGGRDLLRIGDRERRSILGAEIALIFQNPQTALNPVVKVGKQIVETLRAHNPRIGRRRARADALKLMAKVRIPDPPRRFVQYPFELSGGMQQRVVIAIAMANNPRVLIADEPTTALDVTVQAEILELILIAREETQAATALITHDLGVIAEVADRVAVMYAGRLVETGTVQEIFETPRHPYTAALLASQPKLGAGQGRVQPIPGEPPDLLALGVGCPFVARCALSKGRARCVEEQPPLRALGAQGQTAACHFAEEMS